MEPPKRKRPLPEYLRRGILLKLGQKAKINPVFKAKMDQIIADKKQEDLIESQNKEIN